MKMPRAAACAAAAIMAGALVLGLADGSALAAEDDVPLWAETSTEQEQDKVDVVVRLEAPPEGATASAEQRHEAMREQIAAIVGEPATSPDLAEGEDFFNAIDGFTARVPAEALEEIRELDGVADAFIEREWEIEPGELEALDAADAGGELELHAVQSSNYDGTGRLIAVLDSGLLTSHEAFSGWIDAGSLAMTRTRSAAVVSEIAKKGRAAAGRWVSSKIPFACDYSSGDNEVGPQGALGIHPHGTWVTAIAAANGGQLRGVAPQAQVAMLKIGEATSSGSVSIRDSAYLAAIDDVALLKPDVVNLSLGTPAGDMEADGANDTYAAVFRNLESLGVELVAAAGNYYDAPYSQIGSKAAVATSQPDTGVISSPGTYRHSLAVAAASAQGKVPDFSSWGPTADLRLKPEIAALGVGVRAANSSSTNSYSSALDGTSMAAPYLAGSVAAMRQRIASSSDFAALDPSERSAAVYQLLMGTADPATDASAGTYYSPRRQGAGMVDLAAALKATVIPSVAGAPDASRPKAELGDGTSGWTFQIQLRNLGSQAATYSLSASALSEKVSAGSFARSSANWAGKGISVRVSSPTVVVPARGQASVTVSIAAQPAFASWVAANAPKGTFVDGFVLLRATAGGEGAQDLTVPFLGFYGDWASASVFDAVIGKGSPLKAGVGLFAREQRGRIPLGTNPFDASVTGSSSTWTGKVKANRAVIGRMAAEPWNAAASQGIPDWIVPRTAMMRGAAQLDYVLVGPDGQERKRWTKKDVRRSNAAGSSYNAVVEEDNETGTDPMFAARTGAAQYPDGQYILRLVATVAGTDRVQSLDLPFRLDSAAPDIEQISAGSGTVRLRIREDTYLAATQVGIPNPDGTVAYFAAKELYSDVEPAGGAYEVTLSTDALVKAWAASGHSGVMPSAVALTAWDYAANSSTIVVGLPESECAVPAGPVTFRDVPASHPFASDIAWLSQRGITTGWPDGTFRPQEPVTRAAFAAFLYRMAGCPAYAPPSSTPFRDVPVTHSFYREISWAASMGITRGWADGSFRPEAPITRDAIAAFLYRFAGSPEYVPGASFVDVAGNEHRTAIDWMASTGISTGWPDATFRPGLNTERAAIAAFLHRFASL